MRLLNPHGIHESDNIVRENLGGIHAFGFVRFTSPPEVQRDAGKVLGVLCHLEGVTSVIGSQIRNENQRLSSSLLVIVYRDVVGFDLRHGSLSFHISSVTHYTPESQKKASRIKPGRRGLVEMLFLSYAWTGTGVVSGPAAPQLISPTLNRTNRRIEIF